ncbi:MAG: hypothetical protein ACFBZ8_07085 [Opitutales bacterium]
MKVRIRHHNEEHLLEAVCIIEQFEAGEIPRRAEYLDEQRNDWFPIFYLVEEMRRSRQPAGAALPAALPQSQPNYVVAAQARPTTIRSRARAYDTTPLTSEASARTASPIPPARSETNLVVEANKSARPWKPYQPVPTEAYLQYLQHRDHHPIARKLLNAFLTAGIAAQVPLAIWMSRSELGWWAFPILVATTLAVVSGYFVARGLLNAADAAVDSGARTWSR